MTRVCRTCQKEKDERDFYFTPKGKPTRSCCDCIDKADIHNTRDEYLKMKAREAMKSYIGGWDNVEEIAEVARAQGMSYGQYKAFLRRRKNDISEI